MARKKRQPLNREAAQYHCRDCERSYDWNSKALDGHLILCRCPLRRDGGKYCVFLSDPACEDFIQRKQA